jgi:hypothetical protein
MAALVRVLLERNLATRLGASRPLFVVFDYARLA